MNTNPEHLKSLGFSEEEFDDFKYHTKSTVETIAKIRSMSQEDLDIMVESGKALANDTGSCIEKLNPLLERHNFPLVEGSHEWNRFGNPHWFGAAAFDEANRRVPGIISDSWYELIS